MGRFQAQGEASLVFATHRAANDSSDGFFDEKAFDGQTDLTAIRVAAP